MSIYSPGNIKRPEKSSSFIVGAYRFRPFQHTINENYGFNPGDLNAYLFNFLDKLEIWVVPTHNPEGLKVVHGYCSDDDLISESLCVENNSRWIEDPSYRKNIRDVNLNDEFIQTNDWIPVVGQDRDGVDLNRNYDINWIFGHDKFQMTSSCNTYYHDDFDYYCELFFWVRLFDEAIPGVPTPTTTGAVPRCAKSSS